MQGVPPSSGPIPLASQPIPSSPAQLAQGAAGIVIERVPDAVVGGMALGIADPDMYSPTGNN